VITTTGSYETLLQLSDKITDAARKSGLFLFVNNSLKFDKPEITLDFNRAKVAELGVGIQNIGQTLSTALSGGYTNYFSLDGRSYEVIPQLMRKFRSFPEQLNRTYVTTASGVSIPLSTVAKIQRTVQPNSLTQFNQLNSATIQGLPTPGRTIGQALEFLQHEAGKVLPKGVTYDYAGQSRSFITEGSALVVTFFLAIIIIFLVLAAQFESFRDPFIIIISVPMSLCGALIFLNIGLASINIYTQVGLITLIGLITKHGILMVDFANKLQIGEGLDKRAAIEKSAGIRLRPILMTTAAMVLGVVPLLLASGAGAVSRFDIGLVISTGMLIGTIFTLFVIPTMYTFFAKQHTKIE
jgi:multidrug efflux pump